MFNYDRMNDLIKTKGIKKAHICRELGKSLYYLRDAEKNQMDISGDTLKEISDILDTTPEYLTGETDKKEKPAAQGDGTLSPAQIAVIEMVKRLPPEKAESLLDTLLGSATKS